MRKEDIIRELNNIRIRIMRLEAEMLPTEKPTKDDLEAMEEAIQEHERGETLRVR